MKKYQESKTIPELFEMYLREREIRGVTEKTVKTYTGKFKTVCAFYLATVSLERLIFLATAL